MNKTRRKFSKESLSNLPIVLASSSPRRLDLMSQVKLKVIVQAPQVDETPFASEKPAALVKRLSQIKAESVSKNIAASFSRCIIIAADTIVVSPGGKKILGKPDSVSDAKKMLKILSGKTHTVLTGYCIVLLVQSRVQHRLVEVVKSKVKMRSLSPQSISAYVDTGEPLDKAGSYGAQGIGMALIEKIEGSYANVIGLPVAQILADFEKELKIPFLSWLSVG